MGGEIERDPPVVREAQRDLGMGERDALDRLQAVRVLGLLGAQEPTARRRVEEQVEHLDAGALCERGRPDDRLGPCSARRAGVPDPPAVAGPGRAAGQGEIGHRRDRCQRLATEAQRRNRFEVFERGDLAGGVAGQRKREILLLDAVAVVGHRDATQSAAVELDLDPARPRVDRVLQQFLDRGGRPLDHLAGGDLADQQVREGLDAGHGEL
jgi:hypothetical protein